MASPDKVQILKSVRVEVVTEDYPEMAARRCETFIQTYLNEPQCDFTIDIKAVPYTINEY